MSRADFSLLLAAIYLAPHSPLWMGLLLGVAGGVMALCHSRGWL